MTERDDQRTAREQNLAELAALGRPLLPNRFGPIRHSGEITANFEALEGSRVRVAGRLMRVRHMGKASFGHIQDGEGQLQLYFKLDVLGETGYQYFRLLDTGDIIGAEGTVFKTRTGEVTVQVEDLVLLAKSYRPLPDKFHGLTDVEMRYRRRYLDLIANEDTRRMLQLRSSIVAAVRLFLKDRGFTEVETPTLQPLYGGGVATPFETRYEALDITVYLRIATELYLKRLLVGGMERVFEIGKDFRNEHFSRKHSPEFTMLELYEAYADYRDMMSLMEEMVAAVAAQVLGTTDVEYGGQTLHLVPPWRRLSIRDALEDALGIDIVTASRDDLLKAARDGKVAVAEDASPGKIVEEMVSQIVEPPLIQPTFLCDYPVDFPGSLLAKRSSENPDIVERFEAYMGGMEIANAFTELNDPEDQRRRMHDAALLRGEEHQEVDRDFLLSLEYGMPPTGGLGIGIDRLVMILTGAHHIRETIPFPLLRPGEDDAEP